jgi:predicted glycosyltransferase involved in capsule biosynthesis
MTNHALGDATDVIDNDSWNDIFISLLKGLLFFERESFLLSGGWENSLTGICGQKK